MVRESVIKTIGEGKLEPVSLQDIYKAHYGEDEYTKRLERARKYNKETDNGIDIDKIMNSKVLLTEHFPYTVDKNGNKTFQPEGLLITDTIETRDAKTGEPKERFTGNIISLSGLFNVAPDTAVEEFVPIIIPHEGDHAQWAEAGLSRSKETPEWMGEELTPSGNKLTEIFAYGKSIANLLNRYLPEGQKIDPGTFNDPVKEIPGLAEKAKTALLEDLKTADEGRKGIIQDHLDFIEWAKKPFDILQAAEKDKSRKEKKDEIRNTLNEAYKGLVEVKDNRYVIQKG